MSSKIIYQFKVSLRGFKPPIWRRIQIPGDSTFYELNLAILDVFGWNGTHLHEFEFAKRAHPILTIGRPSRNSDPWARTLDEKVEKISSHFTDANRNAVYLYDLGSTWRHDVLLEKILTSGSGEYPRCVAGKRGTPVEDPDPDEEYDDKDTGTFNPRSVEFKRIKMYSESGNIRKFYSQFDRHPVVVDINCLLLIHEKKVYESNEPVMISSTENADLLSHGVIPLERLSFIDDLVKDYVVIHYKDGSRAFRRFHTEMSTLAYKHPNGTVTEIEVYVPQHIPDFIRQYRIGKFLECGTRKVKGRSMFMEMFPRRISLSFIEDMAKFRDILWDYEITAFLFFGTLLGWRRECSIIRHTSDVDFAAFVEEYKPKLLEDMTQGNLGDIFRPYVLFENPTNVAIEIKLTVSRSTSMDLFMVFSNRTTNLSDVYGVRSQNPVRFRFPLVSADNLCAGDLLNRLMYVPCNVDQLLEASYGEDWDVDKPNQKWYTDQNAKTLYKYNRSHWSVVEKQISVNF
ncbi:plasmid pRiA4b ORF-3-like protein [Ditylenchus destructor]|nr:plasmid pRiA4b ORF-3-like protein [Ditylenchus destructor]